MTVELEIVVIGSGRSGTGWAARHLTAAGVACGHESVFDWHPSSHPARRLDYPGRTPSPHEPPAGIALRAESSLAAIAYLAAVPRSARVWHLARDPLRVVRSWASTPLLVTDTPYGRFARAHVPELAAEPTLAGASARWVAAWNLRGHAAADALGLAYKLDRLEDVADDVVNRHVADADPPTWATIERDATPETVDLLRRWADLAGYTA